MPQPIDYVVVGAGSAGCMVARTLLEAGFRVALIEPPGEPLVNRTPARYLRSFRTRDDWGWQTVEQRHLAKRRLHWPRGRGLGGCTRINAMIWYPPTSQDLAALASAAGESWDHDRFSASLEQVTRWVQPETPRWMAASVNCVLDSQASSHASSQAIFNPFSRMTRAGRRRTSADVLFESPAIERLTTYQAVATALLFEQDHAQGVRLRGDSVTTPETLCANHGVILCAGTIGTPWLLMKSGIGDPAQLQACDLQVRHAHRAVGQNLSDHLIMPVIMALPDRLRFVESMDCRDILQWQQNGTGPLSSNLAEAGGLDTLRNAPDDSLSGTLVQYHVTPTHYLLHPEPHAPAACSVGVNLSHPQSRGQLRFRRAFATTADPQATVQEDAFAVEIDPAYLECEADRRAMIAAVKQTRELLAPLAARGLMLEELLPGTKRASDEAILRSIERFSQTLYHPVGSCRMGVTADCVVDGRMAVRGVSGLWIVDASVLPGPPTVNPNSLVMTLAHYAASCCLR